jgi:anti-sigma-K factor RskA
LCETSWSFPFNLVGCFSELKTPTGGDLFPAGSNGNKLGLNGVFKGVGEMSDRQDPVGDQEVVELAALADGSLAPDRRAALEARVAADPELAARLAEQQRVLALMENAVAGVEAPMSLREGIERQRLARPKPRRRRLALALPVPAAAVVLLIAALGVFSSGPAAEAFQVGLVSPVGATAGKATLTKTTSGWRIELRASGLPRLDNGRFYEAWLRNRAGVLVPVGTFNEGKKVTLWAGVSPVDFPLMTVTRERDDGNQASSGLKVLAGTIDTRSR